MFRRVDPNLTAEIRAELARGGWEENPELLATLRLSERLDVLEARRLRQHRNGVILELVVGVLILVDLVVHLLAR